MIDLKQYGYIAVETPPIGLIPGRVTELQRDQYTVITEQGEVTAVLKGTFYHTAVTREDFPCVGDFVFLQFNENGASRIANLLPRRSKFSRADYSGHAAGYVKTILEQVVATNFDYVFIVSSLNWDFKVSRIMRYLTQARQSSSQPVVILTKADLVPDFSVPLAEVQKAAPDVPVHAVSSHTGSGLDELSEYLRPGKTVVLLGMSGVGKSSLLNALMNQEVMTVKAIREADSRGRHTTAHRQLFMLPTGAMVIDTPGMRELGLFGADDGISAGFNDVEELFKQCRFNDCRHQTEPGCAVLAALADGSLATEQWERYLVQMRENRFVDDKSRYLIEKRAWQKSIAMRQKGKKGGYKK
ncbi:ribosome small subunit-dependent GTPase A [Lysinibacillus sp. KCTC 33748]|uniref:ribosome small subunit-dependent GTPase A n=1 Tax=unclassified Lysinibacillus TaxID=2636778 RepID=UPI0009A595AB|nr:MULTISPECIES: ribosome small subunit-dependent GTPase A [unclassified Lysinibacillus]OXS75031.1 ribosome small subunit-dependent GTPase A [Lysinibacillus sp. KCTC 33748]SKB57392.1 ribosome biogenesis GTPase [Lysinibacillus sp. AC-3]